MTSSIAHADPLAAPAPPAVGTARVLVVDDDELLRRWTVWVLRRGGYEVLSAACVDEALICMQEQGGEVRLVISDVVMPKRNGYSLGRVVKTCWPQVEVVLTSGYTPAAMNLHGIQTGEFRLLRKPVSDLVALVEQLIGPAAVS